MLLIFLLFTKKLKYSIFQYNIENVYDTTDDVTAGISKVKNAKIENVRIEDAKLNNVGLFICLHWQVMSISIKL